MPRRTLIRVGQRLIRWDGMRGYVALTTRPQTVFGPGEEFMVEWLDYDGEVEASEYLTLEQFEAEGVRWGRGTLPWAP